MQRSNNDVIGGSWGADFAETSQFAIVIVMIGYLWLVMAFSANGIANVLLKEASLSVVPGSSLVAQLVTNRALIGGLLLFAMNVIFYFLALRALPLSFAYPVMVGMTFLIVVTSSIFFFKESIGALQYAGFAFIVLGLALATMK